MDSWSSEEVGPEPSTDPNRIVRRFLIFLRRLWWIPMVSVLLGAGGGAAYVYWKEPTFVSRSSMWETLKLRIPEGTLFTEDGQNFAGTQNDLLQSGKLREMALALMAGQTNRVGIPRGKNGEPPEVEIRVKGSAKSSVFTIFASSSNPAFTKNYLDALMQVYLQYKNDMRKVISGDTLASISEQMQRWERDLKTEQDLFTAFQRTNNIGVLQGEATVAGGYLGKLRTTLSDLEMEKALMFKVGAGDQSNLSSAESLPFDLDAASPVSEFPVTLGQTLDKPIPSDLKFLQTERARLSRNLRPKHPKIVKIDAEIRRIVSSEEHVQTIGKEKLEASRDTLLRKIDSINASIEEWEGKVASSQMKLAEADRLRYNIQRIQSVYERLSLMVQNVGISRNIDQESLAVLEAASPSIRSYSEEKSGLLLAVFGGLAAGLGLVLLISIRDDRIVSAADIHSEVGNAIIGSVPVFAGKNSESHALLEPQDPRRDYLEAYRNLRSWIHFFGVEAVRPKVLLITSALPNEGKSTVAINLARTMALAGSRVLLVDGDLRRGHLHRLLGLHCECGLTDVLSGVKRSEEALQTTSVPGLKFISKGSACTSPGDLFLGMELDRNLVQWRRDYDYVIFDSSPLFAGDDACCLAPKSDATLFVVRNRHSSAGAVREALALLEERQVKVLGFVYNAVPASSRSNYAYGYEV
jgi:polysaccharide biosynthesis transport protein